MDRRRFLREVLVGTTALWLGCESASDDPRDAGSPDGSAGDVDALTDGTVEGTADGMADGSFDGMADAGGPSACPELAGGEFLEVLAFEGEAVDFHVPVGEGLDGRLYTDLRLVDRERRLTPVAECFVRTAYPDRLDPALPWRIRVRGLATPTELALADLPAPRSMGAHVLECSGNSDRRQFGLLSACEWTGTPLREVLERLDLDPRATRVEIGGFDDHSQPSAGGHSTPGASWIFTFEQLAGAFLATGLGGGPLPPEHGFPVRLVVPGWYGCVCIKWLNSLNFVDDDAPATGQMIEFASRTHQVGTPALARDYRPATLDAAAMPVRVERWRVAGRERLRVVGIRWGGMPGAGRVRLRVDEGPFEPVGVCTPPEDTLWQVFEHIVDAEPGPHTLRCAIDGVPTRRLDTGYYDRVVVV